MPKHTDAAATKPKRTAGAVRSVTRRRKKAVTHEQIAEHAYFLSLRGLADPVANWLQAERELAGA